MKVCYFGTYDVEQSWNNVIIQGLRQNGVEVMEMGTKYIFKRMLVPLLLALCLLANPLPNSVDGKTFMPAADEVQLQLVGQIGGLVQGLFVEGNYAYIGEGLSLCVIDITDPTDPKRMGHTMLPDIVRDVHVSGGYAFVADDDGGLRVISVSDPTNPMGVGFYDTPGLAFGVHVAGEYAYVADGVKGLRVISISNPTSPTEVGTYEGIGYAFGVYTAGEYAYVADWYGKF